MILKEDVEFINNCLETYYENNMSDPYALRRPSGFPEDMMDGYVDEDDWVRWKLLPSNRKEEDVVEIERKYSIAFPPLFRAYLVARFHLFDEVYNDRVNIEMPDLPSYDPYWKLITWLDGWKELISFGYIPFAIYEGGYGPVCFDTDHRMTDGDCPIVYFDHDILISISDEKTKINRSIIELHSQNLYGSFRELMRDLFLSLR
jgi:hypothetical protein